jgi:hypothetical protein
MSSYPTDRKSCGYSIRYIRWLLDSGRVNQIGPDSFTLLVAIVTMEDQLHYERAPDFWREQLLSRCGMKSVHSLISARQRAVDAGLLYHKPGTKSIPGVYFTTGFHAESAQKVNGKRTESEQNTATSIPIPLPIPKEKRPSFEKPSLNDVKSYCTERRNRVNPEQFCDHYEANGWIQGKGKPIRDWKAAVRTWERNGIKNAKPSTDDEYEDYTGKGRRA